MKVNDIRGKSQEFTFDELEAGRVYTSTRFQKYLLMTDDMYTVCLETGEMIGCDQHVGDIFIPVNAVLEVRS